LITTQRGLESIQGKDDINPDLIAHVFITVPVEYQLVPITPPPTPAAKEVGWDEKEIDRIAKMLASNELDEDVAMTTLFGPLDPLFDADVELIDLEAEEDKPGPSNQGLDLNKDKNKYRIKDTLLKGKGRFETSMRKVAGKCYSSFSRIQNVYRLTCLFVLLYMIGFNKALGEIFNDCHERQQGFLLEIPKVVSCKPHMSDEVPYPVNITMWIHSPQKASSFGCISML